MAFVYADVTRAIRSIDDPMAFETFCTRAMYCDGFRAIVPHGGMHDMGQDAREDRIHKSGERDTIILQYAIRCVIRDKALKTLEKLKKNRIPVDQFVLVTTSDASSRAISNLVRDARATYGCEVTVYGIERLRMLTLRFPDELGSLLALVKTPLLERFDITKNTLSTMYTFIAAQQGGPGYLDVVSVVALSALVSTTEALPAQKVQSLIEDGLRPFTLSPSSLDQALRLLAGNGYAEANNGQWAPTAAGKAAHDRLKTGAERADQDVLVDIYERAKEACPNASALDYLASFESFAVVIRSLLFGVFRKRGQTIARLVEGEIEWDAWSSSHAEIVGDLQRFSNPQVAEAVAAAISDTLNHPEGGARELLGRWYRSFVSLEVMGLDPSTRGAARSLLRESEYLLDTESAFWLLLPDLPQHPVAQRVCGAIIEMRARLYMTDLCLREMHAKALRSRAVYGFHGHSLRSYSEAIANMRIHDPFVLAYWYRGVALGWSRELADYDSFLNSVLDVNLGPRGVWVQLQGNLGARIDQLETALPSATDRAGAIYERCMEIQRDRIGITGEEMTASADCDYGVVCWAADKNAVSRSLSAVPRVVVSGHRKLYKGIVRVPAIGKVDPVIMRVYSPDALELVFDSLGILSAPISDIEAASLMGNEWLVVSATQNWDKLAPLTRIGLSAEGINETRLATMVQSGIFSLVERSQALVAGQEFDVDEHMAIVRQARRFGLELSPEMERLAQEYEALKEETSKAKDELETSEEKIRAILDLVEPNLGKKKLRLVQRIVGRKIRK